MKYSSVFEETKIPNSHYTARLKSSGVWLCKYGTLVLCVFCSFTMSVWLIILTLSATVSGHLCQKPKSLGSSNSDEEPLKLGGKESILSLHQLFLWSCGRERWLTITNTGDRKNRDGWPQSDLDHKHPSHLGCSPCAAQCVS